MRLVALLRSSCGAAASRVRETSAWGSGEAAARAAVRRACAAAGRVQQRAAVRGACARRGVARRGVASGSADAQQWHTAATQHRTQACSSTVCATLNVSETSRNLRFSVGTNPARKMLIPSRTANGIVTTPYLRGCKARVRVTRPSSCTASWRLPFRISVGRMHWRRGPRVEALGELRGVRPWRAVKAAHEIGEVVQHGKVVLNHDDEPAVDMRREGTAGVRPHDAQ